MLAVGFNLRIEIGRIPRRVATAHNQEQRTKNQELPKTPAVLHGGGFCVLDFTIPNSSFQIQPFYHGKKRLNALFILNIRINLVFM